MPGFAIARERSSDVITRSTFVTDVSAARQVAEYGFHAAPSIGVTHSTPGCSSLIAWLIA
jgi:hypothetical protein